MQNDVMVFDYNQETKNEYLKMRLEGDHTPVIFLAYKKFSQEIEALKICCGGHMFHPVKQSELSSLVEILKERNHDIHC